MRCYRPPRQASTARDGDVTADGLACPAATGRVTLSS